MATGKWRELEVPHKGWRWIDSVDLGKERMVCEMCESATIRYVHYAEHDNWSGILAVGCICVEYMTEDYVGPRCSEKRLRRNAGRRASFPKRRWKRSKKGNSHIDLDGYHVVLSQRGALWHILINLPNTAEWVDIEKEVMDKQEAMMIAFDSVMQLIAASSQKPVFKFHTIADILSLPDSENK